MSHEHRSSDASDVTGNLIAVLEADAELVDQGGFTFALAQAHEKLAKYRLAEPQAFVLLLVEVAHLLSSCTGISFEIDKGATRVILDGADLRGDEVRAVFDALFLDSQGLDPEAARRGHARRQLASALNTVLGSPQRGRVELRSVLAGEYELRLRFDVIGEPQITELPTDASSSSLSLVIDEPRPLLTRLTLREPDHLSARRSLLYARCRRASVFVLVDGVRIDQGFALPDVIDPLDICDPSGRRIAHGGWSEARYGHPAQLLFVAHGVVTETLDCKDWRPGFVAVVEAGDLARDLSQAKLLRDDAYTQRVALVKAAHEQIQSLSPTNYDGADESLAAFPLHYTIAATGLSMGFPLVALFIDAPGLVIALAFIVSFVIFEGSDPLARYLHRRIATRGTPALGTLLAANREAENKSGRVELTLRVEVEGKTLPGTTSIKALLDPNGEPQLQEGSRVYLRVDPDNEQRIVLARKSW
jgi:hypothetical protein